MSAIRVRPAADFSMAALADLFNRGYSGYYVPLSLGEPAFREMVEIQDIDLGGSRVLEGDEGPIGFALLGVRGARGWIGGMGVAPEARGRGLGREAMRAVIESGLERGLGTIDLEVLIQNAPAIPIYEALGFRDTRELGVWTRDAKAAGDAPGAGSAPPAGVEPIAPAECLARWDEMRRARPPWQRERPVFERSRDKLAGLGVREGGAWKAWVAFRAHEGQLRLLDFAHAEGAADRLDACLAGMLEAHPGASALFLNVPMEAVESRALERAGFTPKFRQREMRLER